MRDLPHCWLGAESCLSCSFPIKAGTTLWIHTEEASSSYRLICVFKIGEHISKPQSQTCYWQVSPLPPSKTQGPSFSLKSPVFLHLLSLPLLLAIFCPDTLTFWYFPSCPCSLYSACKAYFFLTWTDLMLSLPSGFSSNHILSKGSSSLTVICEQTSDPTIILYLLPCSLSL